MSSNISPLIGTKILILALDNDINTQEVSDMMTGFITFTVFLGIMKMSMNMLDRL